MSVSKEVRANSAKFMQSWNDQAQKNWNEIQKSDKIIESYQRIAVFNSLRVDILEKCLSKDSYMFVQKAHNDLLTCHVSSSLGSWRSALIFRQIGSVSCRERVCQTWCIWVVAVQFKKKST